MSVSAARAWTFGKPASDRVVLYIRHAESSFNAKQDAYFAAHPEIDHTSSDYWQGDDVYDPLEFDAPLSKRGVEQARELGALLKGEPNTTTRSDGDGGSGGGGGGGGGAAAADSNPPPAPSAGLTASMPYLTDLRSASVIVVSPLTRAIQTAAHVFEGLPTPPKLVLLPLIREMVYSSCDVGRYGADLIKDPELEHARSVFPTLEKELLALGTDIDWWSIHSGPAINRELFGAKNVSLKPGTRETVEQVQHRCEALEAWLRDNIIDDPNEVTAVVGHSCVLNQVLGRWLANCEVAGNGAANMRAGLWDGTDE